MSVSTSSGEAVRPRAPVTRQERFPNGAAVLRLCLGMTLLFTAFQEPFWYDKESESVAFKSSWYAVLVCARCRIFVV